MSPERMNFAANPSKMTDKERTHHLSRYAFASPMVKGKIVADVACGTGYGSEILGKAGAAKVNAFDLAPDAIQYARENHSHPAVAFNVGNACDLPALDAGSIDVFISFETIEHLPDPVPFLGEVARALKPDGVFLVSTPCRRTGKLTDKPDNPFHVREWNVPEFRELLQSFFKSLEFFGQTFEMDQGWPLSRTVAGIFEPGVREQLRNHEVLPFPASKLVKFSPDYVLVVCRKA